MVRGKGMESRTTQLAFRFLIMRDIDSGKLALGGREKCAEKMCVLLKKLAIWAAKLSSLFSVSILIFSRFPISATRNIHTYVHITYTYMKKCQGRNRQKDEEKEEEIYVKDMKKKRKKKGNVMKVETAYFWNIFSIGVLLLASKNKGCKWSYGISQI